MSPKFMFCAQNTQAMADSSWKNIQYPIPRMLLKLYS